MIKNEGRKLSAHSKHTTNLRWKHSLNRYCPRQHTLERSSCSFLTTQQQHWQSSKQHWQERKLSWYWCIYLPCSLRIRELKIAEYFNCR